jgi:hypothetical protein
MRFGDVGKKLLRYYRAGFLDHDIAGGCVSIAMLDQEPFGLRRFSDGSSHQSPGAVELGAIKGELQLAFTKGLTNVWGFRKP